MVRPRPCASRQGEGAHEAREARHRARDPAAGPGRAQYEGDPDRAPARHRRRRAKHGLMDLTVDAKGDLEVDHHHTVEDVGICLGQAFRAAVGDKRGIQRYGASFLPMDEALLHAAVDISGRPFLVFNVPVQRTRVSNFDLDLLREFFRAFAFNAELTLHVNMHYGENLHHIAEAVFKAVGRALAEATRLNPRITGIPSTKGTL